MSDSKKRRSGIDQDSSVVSRLVGQAEERQREQVTRGRGKAGHGGKVGQDKTGRQKASYDLSVKRQKLVRDMAQQEDVSQTDIVEAAVVVFYNAWRAGKVDLGEMREPARSLKALWKLNVPDEFSFFDK